MLIFLVLSGLNESFTCISSSEVWHACPRRIMWYVIIDCAACGCNLMCSRSNLAVFSNWLPNTQNIACIMSVHVCSCLFMSSCLHERLFGVFPLKRTLLLRMEVDGPQVGVRLDVFGPPHLPFDPPHDPPHRWSIFCLPWLQTHFLPYRIFKPSRARGRNSPKLIERGTILRWNVFHPHLLFI